MSQTSISEGRNSPILKLIGRLALLGLPFCAILASFIGYDPTMTIRSHASAELVDAPNRNYLITELFLRNNPKRRFNAFIFGSSRAMAFYTKDWEPYLGDSARAFHYNMSSEKLNGIYAKLLFLEREKTPIKHALILFDNATAAPDQSITNDLTRLNHPRVTQNNAGFYADMFELYVDPLFYLNYYNVLPPDPVTPFHLPSDAELAKMRRSPYQTPGMIFKADRMGHAFDTLTGDDLLLYREMRYLNDSANYQKLQKFPPRKQKQHPKPLLGKEHKRILRQTSELLKRNNTDYQIIIGPDYHQIPLSDADLAFLKKTFGADRVHDFSGQNEFTQPLGHYYENSHYRPQVGKAILARVYGEKRP